MPAGGPGYRSGTVSTTSTTPDAEAAPAVSPADADLLETVKRAAVELKRADIPFALCGGWAVYARGGPRSEHDADFALAEQDVPRALDVLRAAGFRGRATRRRTGWPRSGTGATWST